MFRFFVHPLVVVTCAPTAIAQGEMAQGPLTFSAEAWSQDKGPDEAQAKALERDFARWFPKGLVLGDLDGADSDGQYALVLRSPADVLMVLRTNPQAPSAVFSQDRTGPDGVVLGTLGRQVLAAKLNLAYDRTHGAAKLADYVFGEKADAALVGRRVDRVVLVGERALAGEFGQPNGERAQVQKFIDIDKDGQADLSLSELGEALKAFNLGFSKDHREPPIVHPVVDGAAPPVVAPGRPEAGAGQPGKPEAPAKEPSKDPVRDPVKEPVKDPVKAPGGITPVPTPTKPPADPAPGVGRDPRLVKVPTVPAPGAPAAKPTPEELAAIRSEWKRQRDTADAQHAADLERLRLDYEKKQLELEAAHAKLTQRIDKAYTDKAGLPVPEHEKKDKDKELKKDDRALPAGPGRGRGDARSGGGGGELRPE